MFLCTAEHVFTVGSEASPTVPCQQYTVSSDDPASFHWARAHTHFWSCVSFVGVVVLEHVLCLPYVAFSSYIILYCRSAPKHFLSRHWHRVTTGTLVVLQGPHWTGLELTVTLLLDVFDVSVHPLCDLFWLTRWCVPIMWYCVRISRLISRSLQMFNIPYIFINYLTLL